MFGIALGLIIILGAIVLPGMVKIKEVRLAKYPLMLIGLLITGWGLSGAVSYLDA